MTINNIKWDITFVRPLSDRLMREDGSYTVGMTDFNTKTVYINSELEGKFLYRVLSHELVHCASFSYRCEIDPETEEIIADFISLYGKEITTDADYIFSNLIKSLQIHA